MDSTYSSYNSTPPSPWAISSQQLSDTTDTCARNFLWKALPKPMGKMCEALGIFVSFRVIDRVTFQ